MKEKKNFFVESLDECRRLEVREKARKLMYFVMSRRLSDHKVLPDVAVKKFMNCRKLECISYWCHNEICLQYECKCWRK